MSKTGTLRDRKRITPGKIIMWVLLIIVAVVQLFPLIWLVDFSLAKNIEIYTEKLLIIPKEFQWVNYARAFTDGHFLQFLANSLIVNTLAVVLVLVISLMAAYACTRMRWKLSMPVRLILMLGLMIPIHATLLPNYVIYDRLHLTNTLWSLLIPYVAFSLPQGFFLMSGFMESIPIEVEEAAVIDGCGVYRLLAVIVTPMMKTSMVTVAIMTYLNNWNEFMMAMTYLNDNTWKTLPFSIIEFAGPYSSDVGVQFAVMALTALPAVLIYIILNKHITKGVAMGAVKG